MTPLDAQHETPESARRRHSRWRSQVVYVVALALFAVLATFAHFYVYFEWDLALEQAVQHLSIPGMDLLMRGASVFGNGWIPWALTIATTLAFLVLRLRSEAAGLVFSAGGGELANSLIKMLIARPRPSTNEVAVFRHLKTQSFPSGHVIFYICFFGFLFFTAYALLNRAAVTRRLVLVLLAIPIALIGISRVYLGEHWPSDVLGAYLFGGLWLALSVDLYRLWKGTVIG
jgi:membrane-associated phospholipid phosphatase